MMSKVMILEVENNLPELIDKIFREFQVDVKGKKVLIKPNIVSPFPPEKGATTNPAVVGAIVDKCLAQQAAAVWVGDNPGGVSSNSYATAEKAGIAQASRGCFIRLSERVAEVPIKSAYVDAVTISKAILEADYLINVPVFKTSLLTIVTGAVKNIFGYVAGAGKARLHLKAPSRRRFSELLVDIYQLRRPDLNIMDGILAMEGNGPTHGEVRPLNRLLASTDAVALDATMTRMMGMDPYRVNMLAVAEERGLGRVKAEEIHTIGKFEVIPDFKLPTSFKASPEEQAETMHTIGTLKPVLAEDKCRQCGDCEQNCPAQAIAMNPYPEIDPGKCISCFCCAELCLEGALEAPDTQQYFNRIFV
jgi:uncharacterized protein (DUF362 family)